MLKRYRSAAIGLGALVLTGSSLALAAGIWSTLPIIGGGSFCASTVTGTGALGGITGQGQGTIGSICGQTIPAGPSATGLESIPADTGFAGGASPQTGVLPSALAGGYNNRLNFLIGGDFTNNLWQRGTTPVSGASPTTAVMAADRWWAISANNVVTITKQTPASTAADYMGNIGFYSVMRVARPSGTPSGATCVGQTLDQNAAADLIGKNAVFSFYGYAPATFSASNAQVTVQIAYYTAADVAANQSAVGAAGTNTKTFALSASGQGSGIAGYTAVTAGSSPNYPVSTVASAVATVSLTTSPARYSFYGYIPPATAAGTAVTGVGVAICTTPTLTTTVSTDYFEFTGAQLQAQPAGLTTAAVASNIAPVGSTNLPNGIQVPTGFQRRTAAQEQELQLGYSYVIREGALGPSRSICHFTTANSAMQCPIVFPVPMRVAAAMQYSTGFAGFTTTGETTANACTGNATDATVALTPSTSQVMMQCTIASGTTAAVGLSMTLIDNAGTGVISASSEP
jgi:hypothetical protein